jgi:biopolymer transport protein ExbD
MFKRRLKPQNGFLLAAPAVLDLIFLLQIFFLIGDKVVVQEGITVSFPNTQEQEIETVADKMVIYFTKDGQLWFNDQTVENWNALKAKLIEVSKERSSRPSDRESKPVIIISADKDTTYNDIARIMSIASKYASKVIVPTEVNKQ